ncbi:MAG: ATP-dependent RecD-like DNA helicase [Phycisphaerae bacterium]
MNRPQPSPERLTGSIERVTFHNSDNGFAVLKVAIGNHPALTTVVGHLASAITGEFIEATGRWVVNKEHGRQFKAEVVRTTHPATPEGIERYLASGLIKGIGPVFAAKQVGAFGTQVFEIVENTPDRLSELDGIGPLRQKRITESWQEQRIVRQIMVFLHQHGLGTARAVRVYKTYGDDAIGTVKGNPYRLARDIRGIGFKTADQLAERLGIDRASPLRARAGVAHVLQEATTEGHCAFPETELIQRATQLLGIEETVVQAALAHEIGEGRLVRDRVADQSWVYLASLHRAETELASIIAGLLRGDHPLPGIDLAKALTWVEDQVGLSLATTQREAIKLAARNKVLIITGGPGVGKTTIVDSILRVFSAKGLRCLLCAPTGRAAKRMSEATGRQAKTIHRLLEFDPARFAFKRNTSNPLVADLVLIDEVSMVDLPLAYAVMQAVPKEAALILVGDVDQLPSVGPGRVLADLIGSGVVPTVRLTEVFRQASESSIIRAAHQVNAGQLPHLRETEAERDFYFAKADDPDSAADLLVRVVTERIPERFGFDPTRDVQVLTPMHRGVLGTRNLNQVLQTRLNPPHSSKTEIERFGYVYRVGDKVLQLENDYGKDVFNGDLGFVVKVDLIESEVTVDFDGRNVVYDVGELDELIPAYAMSIHKSQGSEFPAVVIPVHTQHYVMLQRNLLYTGITRGKRLVVLVGTERAVAIAVKRADARRRNSGLEWRLARSTMGSGQVQESLMNAHIHGHSGVNPHQPIRAATGGDTV